MAVGNSARLSDEQLLAAFVELLRTAPTSDQIDNENHEVPAWRGRASALFNHKAIFNMNINLSIDWNVLGSNFDNRGQHSVIQYYKMLSLIHQAIESLRISTLVPQNVAVPAGAVFGYFDEVRKIIEQARSDLLFVDRYLEAEFVSRYLPHVTAGVAIRLLTYDRIAQLQPAVEAYHNQYGTLVQVRASDKFHDRFVFVDRKSGYFSGASFKDGARNAPVLLSQFVDTFAAQLKTYEDLWAAAKVIVA